LVPKLKMGERKSSWPILGTIQIFVLRDSGKINKSSRH